MSMADASTSQLTSCAAAERADGSIIRRAVRRAGRTISAGYGAYRRGFDNPVADRLMPVMLLLVAACFVMLMIAGAWA